MIVFLEDSTVYQLVNVGQRGSTGTDRRGGGKVWFEFVLELGRVFPRDVSLPYLFPPEFSRIKSARARSGD